MDRLSSCYFCGAALDATLEERPVVPSSLHPSTDSQQTVVLCVTCKRKLDAVLGTVLDAVEAGEVAADDRSGGTASQSTGAEASGDELESTLGDDEDILTPVGDDADDDPADAADASEMQFGDDRDATDDDSGSTAEGAGADSGDDSNDDSEDPSKKPKYTNSRGAGFRREDEGPVDTGSLTGGAFSDGDDDDESDAGSLTGDAFADDGTGASASGGGDSSNTQSGADGASGSAADSGSASSDDDGSGSTDGDASGRQRDVSLTRLENTKVMRLLENREFPVDRDEFVTVAANAYQVSRDDCDKVIDLAVEHGLLREESGQLYGGDA
ncbi:hypothetical protein [Halosimplex amylolyticum]|uniref:hypothetical protein n=1 Tax=Halosimplex amylolyticum TaxID=3396616 RepID=UPI003F56247D